MNLVADEFTQSPVHELVPCERPLPGELPRNDQGLEVSVVVALNANNRLVEAGLDQAYNFS